jgi:hypothetical protein
MTLRFHLGRFWNLSPFGFTSSHYGFQFVLSRSYNQIWCYLACVWQTDVNLATSSCNFCHYWFLRDFQVSIVETRKIALFKKSSRFPIKGLESLFMLTGCRGPIEDHMLLLLLNIRWTCLCSCEFTVKRPRRCFPSSF